MKNIYKKMTRLEGIYEYVREKVMSGAAARTGSLKNYREQEYW